MKDLLIIGAGGHGKVTAATAMAMGSWGKIYFLDDAYPDYKKISDWDVVGKPDDINTIDKTSTDVVIALGDNGKRTDLIKKYRKKGYAFPLLIHPSAIISVDVQINEGTVIFPNAVVNIGSVIGVGCIINTAATVDHDCIIHDGVHLSPGVNLAGNVVVGTNTWIGIGASVINNTGIGENVIIGAGSVVISDIESNVVAHGVPAGIRKRIN